MQTDDTAYDISDDELENLRTLKDRMKTVKISQVVDKLLDLKQSMVEMYTFLPNPSEHPEMSPDSYKFLLKLINSYSRSAEKVDNFTETEKKIKVSEKKTKSLTDQESQIYKDIENPGINELSEIDQYKVKTSELTKTLKDCQDKIVWLESQILLSSQAKNKKRVNKHSQASWEPDQDFISELKQASFDFGNKLNEIEQAWEKMTGLKFVFGGTNLDRAEKQLKIGFETNLEVKKQEKEKNAPDPRKKHEKGNNSKLAKGNLNKLCANCKNAFNENSSSVVKVLSQGYLEDKIQEKLKNLKNNSKISQFSSGEIENIEGKNEEIGIKALVNEGKDKKVDKSLEELLKIISGTEGADAISGIFEENELILYSQKFRIQLIEIFKDHLNKKCIGMCQHLKRAMNIKRKVNGILYPIKKILI